MSLNTERSEEHDGPEQSTVVHPTQPHEQTADTASAVMPSDGDLEGQSVIDAFASFERDLAALESTCAYPAEAPSSVNESSDGLAFDRREAPEPHTSQFSTESVAVEPSSATQRPAPAFANPSAAPSFIEEFSTMNVHNQLQQNHADSSLVADAASPAGSAPALETDGVLRDVQSSLDSLAGMAHGLSQQKLEMMRVQEALEERRAAALERERQLTEREERLAQQEQRLQEEKHSIERHAEQNATILAERSSALQALAETVDGRDRATAKRAEVLQKEQQNVERQIAQLRARAHDLDEREAGLQRHSADLAARFKQLLDAKERFGAIVKGFNETVRFNTTFSAISKTVGVPEEE